jgi:uncharacterized glyoxalase superfamily protein PhnB
MPSPPLLIPCLRYADAPSAIAFLCEAFGFERHVVYTDSSAPSIVLHGQLKLGDTMVMLGSAVAGEASERYRWRTPAEAGGITMCVYAVVDDIEAHYARAITAHADIVTPLHDNVGYPGRSYTARDPEGNVWDFGNYNPCAM